MTYDLLKHLILELLLLYTTFKLSYKEPKTFRVSMLEKVEKKLKYKKGIIFLVIFGVN